MSSLPILPPTLPFLLLILLPSPPTSTLFPYTTLFRSISTPPRCNLRPCPWPPPGFLLLHVLAVKRSRSEEHTSELQSLRQLVCRLLLEKKKQFTKKNPCIDNIRGWVDSFV